VIGRRSFVVAGAAAVITRPRVAAAQPAGQIARIGILSSSGRRVHELHGGFFDTLRELGWIEGRNLTCEVRWSTNPASLPELAAELVRLKPDVIMAFGPYAAHSAKDATQTIPIVFLAADPVRRGLVASLARPGGNLTGLTNSAENMVGKTAQVLKELLSRAERLAQLVNLANPVYRNVNMDQWRDVIAQGLGVSVQFVDARSRAELTAAVDAALRAGADGLVVTPDPVFRDGQQVLVDLTRKYRLPTIYPWRDTVAAGGLVSYGTSPVDLERRAAVLVDKILKGAKPADLPVEQPTKFDLVINVKTAKALGLTISPSLLVRASELIE
jgi:putative ABC transport system substrate-binding protein